MDATQFKTKLMAEVDKLLESDEFVDAEMPFSEFWESVRDQLDDNISEEDEEDEED
jgi:hypothetical protein